MEATHRLDWAVSAFVLLSMVASGYAASRPGKPAWVALVADPDMTVRIRLRPARDNGAVVKEYRIRCWPAKYGTSPGPANETTTTLLGTGNFVNNDKERKFIRVLNLVGRDRSQDSLYTCVLDARNSLGWGDPSWARTLVVPKFTTPPGKPAIRSMKAYECDEWPGCERRLRIDIKPPTSDNGGKIKSYRVVCLPEAAAVPPAQPARKLQAYAPLTDPSWVITLTGLGTQVEEDRIRFETQYPYYPGTIPYLCNASAYNMAGWGPPGTAKSFTVPTSPPSVVPSIVSASVDAAGVLTVALRPLLSEFGITGYEIVGAAAKQGVEDLSASGPGTFVTASSGPQVEFYWQPGSYEEDVAYSFTAYFVNDDTDQRSGPSTTAAVCIGTCS
ncbi:hypothetical protein ABPG75_008355 [Micractinium tetrahymenae]